jgi:predicted enzyme related to lactoylglutathione lyase
LQTRREEIAVGINVTSVYVDDVQREHDRMQPLGAEFTIPPTKVTGSTIAMLNDTCGNLIQIAALDRWQS